MSIDTTDSETWIGSTLIDRDEHKVGTIEAIYFDQETGGAQWMAVKSGLLGTKHSFVPLTDAVAGDDVVQTPYDKRQVDDAPKVDVDEDLRDDQVAELYGHYGLPYEPPVAVDGVVGPDVDPYDSSQAAQDMRIATGRQYEADHADQYQDQRAA